MVTTSTQPTGLARRMASSAIEEDDYKPTSILITGAAGFIGSHVAIKLIKAYPDVKVRVAAARHIAQCATGPSHSTVEC